MILGFFQKSWRFPENLARITDSVEAARFGGPVAAPTLILGQDG